MSSTVVGYAFTIGLVGLLNPCGFPLLPAYLSLFTTGQAVAWPALVLRGLRAGGYMTAGFLVVFLVLGAAATLVLSLVVSILPWLMLAVSAGILALGGLALTGRTVALHVPSWGFRAGRGGLAMFGFGIAYAAGSLSCSLPLFLAGVLDVFTRTSPTEGITAFLAYALGMGVFVTAASLVASLAGGSKLRVLRPATAVLPRLAGVVCVLAGAYLLAYWMHELAAPATAWLVITDAQHVQATVSAWLGSVAVTAAVLLGAVVVSGFLALALFATREAKCSSRPVMPDPEERPAP